jgi:hypothetical protein
MNTSISTQSGLSFGGFIFGAFLLVVISMFGFRLIPAYIQNTQINSVFNAIVHDPDMQKASLQEVRNSFSKRAIIEDIKVIKPEDIDVSTDGDKLVLSASYTVTVPLVANASLILQFNPSSGK